MALDDYGYYDENGKFIKFKAKKYRRKGSKTYKVDITAEKLKELLSSFRETCLPKSDRPSDGEKE